MVLLDLLGEASYGHPVSDAEPHVLHELYGDAAFPCEDGREAALGIERKLPQHLRHIVAKGPIAFRAGIPFAHKPLHMVEADERARAGPLTPLDLVLSAAVRACRLGEPKRRLRIPHIEGGDTKVVWFDLALPMTAQGVWGLDA